jgi:hypothetical protein
VVVHHSDLAEDEVVPQVPASVHRRRPEARAFDAGLNTIRRRLIAL